MVESGTKTWALLVDWSQNESDSTRHHKETELIHFYFCYKKGYVLNPKKTKTKLKQITGNAAENEVRPAGPGWREE